MTANVALAAEIVSLEQVVVTGVVSDAAPRMDVASARLRLLGSDSSAATKRMVYEVSRGVEVTLVESSIEAVQEADLSVLPTTRRAAETPQRQVNPPRAKIDSGTTGGLSGITRENSAKASDKGAPSPMAMAAIAPAPVTTISWEQSGRRYTLTGPLTLKELETLRTRLMQMRR